MNLHAAGNLEVTAFHILASKGYAIERVVARDSETWTAAKGDYAYRADSPLQLLGVVIVGEERGEGWRASDEQIDAFLERYYGSK